MKAIHNPVRRALLNRELVTGTWIQIGHPAIAEILANIGFEWIAVDCEHTEIDVEGFTGIARALYGRSPVPLVRVRENDTLAIRQMLDSGAQGVIVPLVNSREEAEKAVAAAKFPPDGIRGFAYFRGNEYGADFERYVAEANDEIAVVAMIETKQAIDNIDEIVSVDGIDGVFIGPYDLSGSYGVVGNTGHELIVEAKQKVLDACRKAGKSAGLHVVNTAESAIRDAVSNGFTFIALGMDTIFLDESARRTANVISEITKELREKTEP